MTRRELKRATLVLFLILVTALSLDRQFGATASTQQQPSQPAGQAEEKTAEQTHKNIQVLKGLPDSQLIPMMQLFDASLGVRCEACHVRTPDNKLEFDKDDKKM